MNAPGLSPADALFLQEVVVAATKHPEVQAAAAISEEACNQAVARLLPAIMQARLDRQLQIINLYASKPEARRIIDRHLCQAMYGAVTA